MLHSLRFWAFSLACALLPLLALARSPERLSEPAAVDLFESVQAGDLEANLFLKDSSGGIAVFRNRTDRPLAIKLPEAFAACPIAAQFLGPAPGGPGGGPLGAGNNAAGGGNQTVGGVFGQPNNNNNRRGGGLLGGPALFNIEAGKERKLKIVAVCLEYGKEEPNTRLTYALRPIESITNKPEVVELVRSLSAVNSDQRAIQAAAWRLANGLSWKELAAIPKVRHLNGIVERYFSDKELERAKEYVRTASEPAQQGTPSAASQVRNEAPPR